MSREHTVSVGVVSAETEALTLEVSARAAAGSTWYTSGQASVTVARGRGGGSVREEGVTVAQVVPDWARVLSTVDGESETLRVGGPGLRIAPGAGGANASLNDILVTAQVFESSAGVTAEAAQAMALSGTYNPAMTGTDRSSADGFDGAFEIGSLRPGKGYDVHVTAHGANGEEDAVTESQLWYTRPRLAGVRMVRAPGFGLFADAVIGTETEETGHRVFAAAVEEGEAAGMDAADVASLRDMMVGGSLPAITDSSVEPVAGDASSAVVTLAFNVGAYGGPSAWLPSGSNETPVRLESLEAGTEYRVMGVVEDEVSGLVSWSFDTAFRTLSEPRGEVAILWVGYTRVEVRVETEYEFASTTTACAGLPYDEEGEAVAAFVESGEDPLGTADAVQHVGPVTGYREVVIDGLASGGTFVVANRVVVDASPERKWGWQTEAVTTEVAPTLGVEVSEVSARFAVGRVTAAVNAPGRRVNVYAAFFETGTMSAERAVEELIDHGTLAFPGAVAATDRLTYSTVVERWDLSPGARQTLVVASVDTGDAKLVMWRVEEFETLPLPEVTVWTAAVDDRSLSVGLSNSVCGWPHTLFVHLSPNVYGGVVQYDVAEITGKAASDEMTRVHPGVGEAPYEVTERWEGLQEYVWHGVVTVTVETMCNTVVTEEAHRVRTADLPDVMVVVTGATGNDLRYRVEAADRDSTFEVYTLVSREEVGAAEAAAFAAEGLTYGGGGAVVAGTQTVYPGDVPWRGEYVAEYTSSNLLSSDTEYHVLAVVVDNVHGRRDFATATGRTEAVPLVRVEGVRPMFESVGVDLQVGFRGDSEVRVRYGAYETATGLTAEVIRADPAAGEVTVALAAGFWRTEGVMGLTVGPLKRNTEYVLGACAEVVGGAERVSLVATETFRTSLSGDTNMALVHESWSNVRLMVDYEVHGDYVFDAGWAAKAPGTEVNGTLAREILEGRHNYDFAGNNVRGVTGNTVFEDVLEGLEPGTRYRFVAANKFELSEVYEYAFIEDWTRFEPVFTAGAEARTMTSFAATFDLHYYDYKPLRENAADVVVTLVPSGCNPGELEWMRPGSSASVNPLLPWAPVLSFAAASTLEERYEASFIPSGLDYALAFRYYDLGAAAEGARAIEYAAKEPVQVRVAVANVTLYAATIDVRGSVGDSTMALYAQVYHDAGNVGLPTLEMYEDVVAGGGVALAAGVSYHSEAREFEGLFEGENYLAVAVAVDEHSGEVFRQFAPFIPASAAPHIRIHSAATQPEADSCRLVLEAHDADSKFTYYIRAFPLDDADPVSDAVLAAVILEPEYYQVYRPSVSPTTFGYDLLGLLPGRVYRAVVVAEDAITGEREYDYEDFRTLAADTSREGADYDVTLNTLTWESGVEYALPERGVSVGNGKLYILSSLDRGTALEPAEVAIAGDFDFNPFGGYTNNMAPAFRVGSASFGGLRGSPGAAVFALASQSLDLNTGVLRTEGALRVSGGGGGGEEVEVAVTQDLMALKHLPHCALAMYRLTPASDVGELDLFQELASRETMDGVRFGSTTVYDSPVSLPIMTGDAAVRGSTHRIACASVVLAEGAAGAAHLGFNSFRDSARAFDGYRLRNLQAGVTYRIALLSAQATTADFPSPDRDVARLVVHAVGAHLAAGTDPHAVAVRVRADHVAAWARAWSASADVTHKLGAGREEMRDFAEVKRALRFSQFQLFCSVRDAGGGPRSVDLDPRYLARAGAEDGGDGMFWNRELWTIPALLYTKPRAARDLLERKHAALAAARELAAASGHEGARYPFADHRMAPYWDVAGAGYVFNSALVAVCAWDYFRATTDRDWLRARGYAIISGVADYLVSAGDMGADGVVSFPVAVDVAGARRHDPCFTVYGARLAIKAAIEASYELRYPVRQPWAAHYDGLRVRFRDPPNADVIRHSTDHNPAAEPLAFPESLLLLHPHYVTELLRVDRPRHITTDHETLLHNAEAALAPGALASPIDETPGDGYGGDDDDDATDPFATLLVMACLAQVSRATGEGSPRAHALLLKALRDSKVDVWGAMAAPRAAASAASSAVASNDLALNAMFYLTFVGCFAGLHISGGVAQSGFYYAPMGVRAHACTYLPRAWSGVVVTTHDRVTHNIINRQLFELPAAEPP